MIMIMITTMIFADGTVSIKRNSLIECSAWTFGWWDSWPILNSVTAFCYCYYESAGFKFSVSRNYSVVRHHHVAIVRFDSSPIAVYQHDTTLDTTRVVCHVSLLLNIFLLTSCDCEEIGAGSTRCQQIMKVGFGLGE